MFAVHTKRMAAGTEGVYELPQAGAMPPLVAPHTQRVGYRPKVRTFRQPLTVARVSS